ncbi:hypothetical protein ElyMa_000144500, partial [Elysia marginata]
QKKNFGLCLFSLCRTVNDDVVKAHTLETLVVRDANNKQRCGLRREDINRETQSLQKKSQSSERFEGSTVEKLHGVPLGREALKFVKEQKRTTNVASMMILDGQLFQVLASVLCALLSAVLMV